MNFRLPAGRNGLTDVRLFWTPRARENLIDLQEYITADSPKAAFQVADRIRATANLLRQHPNLGRTGQVAGTREMVVSHTPYILAYRINEMQIEVLAVAHGKQRWPEAL